MGMGNEVETWCVVVTAYMDAWNRHDAQGVAAVFAEGGTYEDSSTGRKKLTGSAIAAMCDRLFTAFPDLRFEPVYEAATGEDTAITQWVMRGTNTGSLNGLPPTGRDIALPGIDVITMQGDRITSLRGYFDRQDLMEQLGLNVIVQPKAIGPFTFGISSHVSAQGSMEPGALSMSWLDLRAEDDVRDFMAYGREVMADMAGMDGHHGTWIAMAGNRAITLSAWASAADVEQINRSPAHQKSVRTLFERFGSAVGTSVWVNERFNRHLVRCEECGKMNVYARLAGQCGCGAKLPDVEGYL